VPVAGPASASGAPHSAHSPGQSSRHSGDNRQCEHYRVTENRLQVEQVAVEVVKLSSSCSSESSLPVVLVMSIAGVAAAVGVQEELLEAGVTDEVSGVRQRAHSPASGAIAVPVASTPSETASEPDLKGHVSPDRHADKLRGAGLRARDDPRLGQRGSRWRPSWRMSKTAPLGVHVLRVLGMTVYSCRAKGNRAHSLTAVRCIPNLTMGGMYSAPARHWHYFSALLFGQALGAAGTGRFPGPGR